MPPQKMLALGPLEFSWQDLAEGLENWAAPVGLIHEELDVHLFEFNSYVGKLGECLRTRPCLIQLKFESCD